MSVPIQVFLGSVTHNVSAETANFIQSNTLTWTPNVNSALIVSVSAWTSCTAAISLGANVVSVFDNQSPLNQYVLINQWTNLRPSGVFASQALFWCPNLIVSSGAFTLSIQFQANNVNKLSSNINVFNESLMGYMEVSGLGGFVDQQGMFESPNNNINVFTIQTNAPIRYTQELVVCALIAGNSSLKTIGLSNPGSQGFTNWYQRDPNTSPVIHGQGFYQLTTKLCSPNVTFTLPNNEIFTGLIATFPVEGPMVRLFANNQFQANQFIETSLANIPMRVYANGAAVASQWVET